MAGKKCLTAYVVIWRGNMGKSPKPLSFLICPALITDEEATKTIQALADQGHTFHYMTDDDICFSMDIILGPNCWRAFDLKYLDLAIRSARSVKYGKAKKPIVVKAKSKGKKSPGRRKANNAVDAAQLRTDDTSDESNIMAGSSGSRE